MAEHIENEARYIDINKVTIPTGFFNQDLNTPKLLDWLYSQPPADVAEVKHGEWVTDEKGFVTCSECGEEHTWDDFRPPYCDMCGARMDGGKNV